VTINQEYTHSPQDTTAKRPGWEFEGRSNGWTPWRDTRGATIWRNCCIHNFSHEN